eukprot:4351160-Karenia_brevis.AAC.1
MSEVKQGLVDYIHLGVPCKTWAVAGRLNGGTRRKGCVMGDGSLERERAANVLVLKVCEFLRELRKYGVYFSIENPHGSHLFEVAE